MLINHHHHYHFTTNNIITVVIKPYCEDYRVNESNGSVTVCLMKDLETAVDLNVTFEAKQTTPPDALCKLSFCVSASNSIHVRLTNLFPLSGMH